MNTYEGPLIPYAKDQLPAIFYFGDIYHYVQGGVRFAPLVTLGVCRNMVTHEGLKYKTCLIK